jgi:hypothetical protein
MVDKIRWFDLPGGAPFSIPEEWLTEAAIHRFQRKSQAFASEDDPRPISIIPIADIKPFDRSRRVPLSHGGFDQARMISLLRGIVAGAKLPPIEVTERNSGSYRYRLIHGAHRFHASVIAGFTHIPAVPGWEPETPALNQ